MRYLFLLFFTSCASYVYNQELRTQDCITEEMKVLTLNDQPITKDLYKQFVDTCKSIHRNRP